MIKKKIERWFYLQLQLMLNMYFRKGNTYFTYEETNTLRTRKALSKFYKNNDIELIRKRNHRYWNKNYDIKEGVYK